ncbi:PTS lactose/cellobiose transporter subunit IIA [Lacticaseibacillus sp. 53-4]|uniref:PTS lactose/cellobiose transporter subunit IIA n=1 Tax=Lacticaseibacillus sp. 53-4 TaxID=2799575 RepID=UPI00194489E3|nr:PTS lactose/cellobiose transporter subunit IIA [Lacticaseibacillus sp. 53-4]
MDEKQLKRAMQLIAIAGNARSEVVRAMQSADEEKFDEADELLAKAKKDLHDAHNIQTQWMSAEMGGEVVEKSLLLIHSQDHFIAADIMMTVATEHLAQAKKIKALEAKLNA